MGHFSCVVQDDSAAARATGELESQLAELHERHHPGDTVSFSWRGVPIGFMFTEGRQSSSSIIACVMERRTTRDERERYMRGVCDVWTRVTGCTDHEVVVAITDVDPVS